MKTGMGAMKVMVELTVLKKKTKPGMGAMKVMVDLTVLQKDVDAIKESGAGL